MRLGTCIALELAVAAGAGGAVVLGAARVIRDAGAYVDTREAAAATTIPIQGPEPLPASSLPVRAPAPLPTVFGTPDEVLLAPLGAARVIAVKLNHGGTSVSLRIDFANGTRAAFKPEQTWSQSDPRREIAAYRIDRLLRIGHVPPAKEGAIAVADLLAVADPVTRPILARRLADEAIARDGVLHGELSWWVPQISIARIDGVWLDEQVGRDRWNAYLQVGATIPRRHRPLIEQLSALIVFDVLIDNADRWTGGNLLTSPDGKVLYFMDNAFAFSKARFGHVSPTTALREIQVFPRGLVQRLRALTEDQLVATLATSSESELGPLLQPEEIRAIIARRDNMLTYIDQLIAERGEPAVLAFP